MEEKKTYSGERRGRKPQKFIEDKVEEETDPVKIEHEEKPKKEKLHSPTQASIILGIGGYDRVVLLKKYRGEKKTIKDWKNIFKK